MTKRLYDLAQQTRDGTIQNTGTSLAQAMIGPELCYDLGFKLGTCIIKPRACKA